MQNIVMDENSNRIHSSKERLNSRTKKDFNKSRDAEYVERNDHSKRDGEMLKEASTQVVR